MKNIGVLMYTYNRVDDAKINMEIIRNVWQKTNYFDDVKIVHAYNGKKEWYPKKYLENDLVIIKNSWHFQGAADLIDAGIKKFKKKYKETDYVIVLASDTWLVKPVYVENLLKKMKNNNLYLATCSWGNPDKDNISDVGMAVDFFIVDLKWANTNKFFPINYGDFYKKYEELFMYQSGGTVMLEKLLFGRYVKAIGREDGYGGSDKIKAKRKMLIMKDREPVHSHVDKDGRWIRIMYWQKMGLITHHDPKPKKQILIQNKINTGEHMKKLLRSTDLSYFNGGVTKTEHSSN